MQSSYQADAARILGAIACACALASAGCKDQPSKEQQRARAPKLRIQVTDGVGGPSLAARMLLIDEAGEPVRIGTLDRSRGTSQHRGFCELAHGAIGTYDGILLAYGEAEIPYGTYECDDKPAIPYGRYRVQVWRGIEYHLAESTVDLSQESGDIRATVALQRAFAPDGAVSADLHVHAQDSNDSNVPTWVRVIAQASSGIQFIGASEHNYNADFDAAIEQVGLTGKIASIAGNEATINGAHIGLLDVRVDPERARNGAPKRETLLAMSLADGMAVLSALPEQPFLQINHPRLGWQAMFTSARWNGRNWPPSFPLTFDGVEVLAGTTLHNEAKNPVLENSLRDFYTFIANGHIVTAIGSSDTHDFNLRHDGIARTYVFLDAAATSSLDERAFLDALRARRVVATTGPWLDVQVEFSGPGETVTAKGQSVHVSVRLQQASFVHAERVRIRLGTAIAHDLSVPQGATSWSWEGDLAITEDTWVGVDASGDTPLPAALTGTYQHNKGRRGVMPYALINPILIDADGDGQLSFVVRP